MGVSNEDEANYWAYVICVASDSPRVKYSGYYSLLPYVLTNASRVLATEEYYELLKSNKISTGTANYLEVIDMIISIPA